MLIQRLTDKLRLQSFGEVALSALIIGVGCSAEPSLNGRVEQRAERVEGVEQSSPQLIGKADEGSSAFPAARDLALLLPLEDARLRWVDQLPSAWLSEISGALERSELGEDILDESWEEDWRLVSARFTTCQPLGRVAEPEELDALCWPQLRLVWQPVIPELSVTGVVRPWYADDRAIHTLFFAAPEEPELKAALSLIEGGSAWRSWSPTAQARFAEARDRVARSLLSDLEALRGVEGPYEGLEERPELYSPQAQERFFERLAELLRRRCGAEQLSELTAFSLPLGRNPAAADLWSFVAFKAEAGALIQTPLAVRSAETGEELFAFAESEDVTTGHGDAALDEALEVMPAERAAALRAQVITDTAELPQKVERINDPYQTTVAHTTCASCHRANNINFNFHNLSYLEDQAISVSPRVRADLERDLKLAEQLWRRSP